MRITLFLWIIIGVWACSEQAPHNGSTTTVPELLDRSEILAVGQNWDRIQNNYVHYKNAIQTKNDIPSHIKLTELFIQEARLSGEHGHYYPGALQIINKALEQKCTKDEQFVLYSHKASVLLSQHQFQEAYAVAQQALALNAYSAQVYGALVDACIELGRYDEAVEMADKMISVRPDQRSYARVSYLRQIHGDYAGAIEAMEMAVQAGVPGSEERAWSALTLGQLHEAAGDQTTARKIYTSILEERENYPFAIGAIAWLDLAEGDIAAGEKGFLQAAAVIPEVDFYIALSEIAKHRAGADYATDKNYQESIATVLEMFQDDIDHGHIMDMSLVDFHLRTTGNYKKALDYAVKEFNARPENIDVNKMMAISHYFLNNYDDAAQHLQKTAVSNNTTNDTEILSALIAYKQGKPGAMARLKKSMRSPQHVDDLILQEAKNILS